MSEYSVEEVRAVAKYMRGHGDNLSAAYMLDAYADLREQIERAREGVTVDVVELAITKMSAWATENASTLMCHESMRAALQSIAHPPAHPVHVAGVYRHVAIRLAQYGAEYAYRRRNWSIEPLQYGCEEHIDEWIAQAIDVHTADPVAQGEAVKSKALEAINEIRNSIIGTHIVNWSEHVYPLVEALDSAGYEGLGYPASRAHYGTLIERCNAAEAKLADLLAAQPASPEQPAGRQGEAVADIGPCDFGVGIKWANGKNVADFVGMKLYTHPAAPVGVPDGWRELIEWCATTAGTEVNGNQLSAKAKQLLAAAPSAPQEQKVCTRNCDCVGPCKMGDE